MKKIILMGVISLGLTGCFTNTVKPDEITKNIMTKYNIQYLNEKKEAKKWLCNSIFSDNFRIHIEVNKKDNFEKVKEAILHAYDKKNRKELNKYYLSRENSSEEILKSQKNVSNISIERNEQVSTINDKNVFYTIIKSYSKVYYIKYYKEFGRANYNGIGTLTYKYGFIEPQNSDKAYFYTSHEFDYNKNEAILANGDRVSSMDDVRISGFLRDDKDEYDNKLIKKTIDLLKSNNIVYKYISDEYNFVKGKLERKSYF